MGEIHPISKRLFQEKVLGCQQLIKQFSYALYLEQNYIGFVAIKKSLRIENKNKLYLSMIHIIKESRNQGYGKAILKDLFQFMQTTNYSELIVGGDEKCIFSGVFHNNNETTHAFFQKEGFEVHSNNMNLIVSDSLAVEYKNNHAEFIFGITETQKQEALHLIKQHFSERWYDEVEESDIHDIGVLFDDNKIVGFINTGSVSSKQYPNSMNDYLLFENLSGIGPLGIIPEYQGKGLGLYMVNQALQALFHRGASDIMVDWTGLEYFYKKCGFKKIYENYTIYKCNMEDIL